MPFFLSETFRTQHEARSSGFERLVARAVVAALPTTFAANRRFPLPLPLCARLLVEAPLAKLGVKAGALNLPLELTQGPLEVFALLHDHFQSNHHPWANRNQLNYVNPYTNRQTPEDQGAHVLAMPLKSSGSAVSYSPSPPSRNSSTA